MKNEDKVYAAHNLLRYSKYSLMALSERQFNYLSEMGITVWCAQQTINNEESSATASKNSLLAIEKVSLEQSQLFADVLLYLDVTFSELTITQNKIAFELFNWSFSEANDIQLNQQELITPDLNKISTDIKMKKTLWQQLQTLNQ